MKEKKSTIRTKKSNTEFYVNPEEMWKNIVDYYEDPTNTIPSSVAKNIQDIAEKISYMGCFMNYSWRHEMIGDAKVKMMEAIAFKKFKPWKDEIIVSPEDIRTINGEQMVHIEGAWRKLEKDEAVIGQKIVAKNNAFSYFTRIAYHAFLNRLKREKRAKETIDSYQEKVWEDYLNSGNGWENVRRPRIMDADENDDCSDYCD